MTDRRPRVHDVLIPVAILLLSGDAPAAELPRPKAEGAVLRVAPAPRFALTECHLALPGRNRGDVLSTWAAGVGYARMLNLHERHGDRLKIATLADFCGNRWQVNAVMIPTPGGTSFLMPVARVMSLYRRHGGAQALEVAAAPEGLDVTASRTDNRLFLHVVNTSRAQPVEASLALAGVTVASATAFEIAADPGFETIAPSDVLAPRRKDLPKDGRWTFPAASVTAVEVVLHDP